MSRRSNSQEIKNFEEIKTLCLSNNKRLLGYCMMTHDGIKYMKTTAIFIGHEKL
jgi:hypothetical protein